MRTFSNAVILKKKEKSLILDMINSCYLGTNTNGIYAIFTLLKISLQRRTKCINTVNNVC